jgi:hypothetical protein
MTRRGSTRSARPCTRRRSAERARRALTLVTAVTDGNRDLAAEALSIWPADRCNTPMAGSRRPDCWREALGSEGFDGWRMLPAEGQPDETTSMARRGRCQPPTARCGAHSAHRRPAMPTLHIPCAKARSSSASSATTVAPGSAHLAERLELLGRCAHGGRRTRHNTGRRPTSPRSHIGHGTEPHGFPTRTTPVPRVRRSRTR